MILSSKGKVNKLFPVKHQIINTVGFKATQYLFQLVLNFAVIAGK